MKMLRQFFPRAESDKINADIDAAFRDVQEATAETYRTLQSRHAANAVLQNEIDRAKVMTTNFADFEKNIRRRTSRVH